MAKLSKKDYEYRHEKGSVSSLNYHFVFCPKRRKAVLVNNVAKRLQEITGQTHLNCLDKLFFMYIGVWYRKRAIAQATEPRVPNGIVVTKI